MKIIGIYATQKISHDKIDFLDAVFKSNDYDYSGDFAIDISRGHLLIDPRRWLDKKIAAFYGDFVDAAGNYRLQTMFPSRTGDYPGVFFNVEELKKCKTQNPLKEISESHILSYIPEATFRILT